jgi:lycopene elongase/hydratase (dihydrobisanhydrobacterioruberin-forming)
MLSGLKIVIGVVAYRLRKLEMANLAAAVAIAIALGLGPIDVLYRTIFAFVLNVLVYLNNDYLDVGMDLNSTGKDTEKTRYLAEHLRAALVAQITLSVALVAFALAYDPGLLVALALGGGICILYSAYWKRTPFMDIPAMMVWGLGMPLCGVPWKNVLGWCMAIQLGWFSGVFESIQVMRDADEDALEGVRTTGVVLGKAKTLFLARALMVVSSIYAALVLHPVAAGVSAIALGVPFSVNDIARYWTQVKLVYGIAWLVICGLIFLQGHSAGLLWSIDRATLFR